MKKDSLTRKDFVRYLNKFYSQHYYYNKNGKKITILLGYWVRRNSPALFEKDYADWVIKNSNKS
jgi:hypothetical protein